jgi:serine/threonine-protein kinase
VITLTLLHPVQATPVQSWTFDSEAVIRIGRAVDNHVVLYSAVVSRHHVELRRHGLQWEVVNLGTNGTYLDGKRVQQAPLLDGGILRLARSGPNIQVRLSADHQPMPPNARMATIPETARTDVEKGTYSGEEEAVGTDNAEPLGTAATGMSYQGIITEEDDDEEENFAVQGELPAQLLAEWRAPPDCSHSRAEADDIFCIECGVPLKVWKTLGNYQIIKALGQSNTYLGWRNGQTAVVKGHSLAASKREIRAFQRQVRQLCQMSHPVLPKFWEGFQYGTDSYLVSEMVYGHSLKQWINDHGVMNVVEASRWLIPICDLLTLLHQQDPPILHLHIRPSNLIHPYVSREATNVVLVGWGKASVLTSESGTFIGTVGYSAPEQQEGKPEPASDLYGLGATIVYLLTGNEPDTYFRWGAREYRLYAEDIPHLDPLMVDLINCLTHPDPRERYPNAAAVKQRLEQIATIAMPAPPVSSAL